MFKIAKNLKFTTTIPVLVPSDEGHLEQSLKVRFRVVPVDEVRQFDTTTGEGSDEFLRAVVDGFPEVVDESGLRQPDDAELRETMLMLPFVRAAVTSGYFAAVNKARLGN